MDATVADPLVGKLLSGRYRIRSRIAHGGMATVYQAIDTRLERIVALKMIHPSYAGNPDFLARFDREAKTVARLTHPNVVAVFDSGAHDNLPYLVMEYVPGRTLRDVLAERGRLSPQEAMAVGESMLAALASAHRAGLVHRDVKPENILINSPDGSLTDAVVKVADFGLARAVESGAEEATGGQLMATVAYVAPELVRYGRADQRTDVYSAGIVLYEMLTGSVPFHGANSMDVAYQHVEHDVPAPSSQVQGMPPDLDEVVVRATRRDPGARQPNAEVFAGELRAARAQADLATVPLAPRAVAHHTVVMPQDRRQRELEPLDREVMVGEHAHRTRRGLLIALAAIVVLGLVAGIGGWWLGAGRYTSAPTLLSVTRAQAQARAHEKGFSVDFAPGEFSETAPKNTVLSQDPEPGDRILSGGTITVVLSKGPERYTIPKLAGRNVSDASEELRSMHLAPSTTERYDPDIHADAVISVSPKPGTVVRRGAAVHLVVSKGPAPVTVPDVRGKDGDDAKDQLTGLGLNVTVKEQESDSVDEGSVISQTPAPGTGVEKDTGITITVSTGPPKIAVPDVTGLKYHDAKKKLEDAGFEVRGAGIPRGDGTVRSQSPGGGDQAPKGSTITLWVL